MKRFFFSLIALAAVAASCTQSTLVEAPDLFDAAITFSPYTGRTPVTKAASIEGTGGVANVYGLSEAGGFNVYGFLNKTAADGSTNSSTYMNDVNVYVPEGGSTWTYDEIMYWPDANSDYTMSFAAYSANAKNLITWDDQADLTFTYKVPNKVSNQVDLLATNYQDNLKATSNGGKVTLDFKHLLSRVGFKLVSTTNDQKVDVVIKSVKLVGKFPLSGSVNLLSKDIAIDPIANTNETVDSYELMDFADDNAIDGSFITKNTTTPTPIYATHVIPTEVKKGSEYIELADDVIAANALSRYMMVIPHEVTDATDDRIVVSYQLTDSKPLSATIPLKGLNFNFEPSKAYEFYLSISTKSIGFHVEEYEWDGEIEVTKPLTPAETAIKIISATEAIPGSTATINAQIKNEQYESIVIESFNEATGEWVAVTDPQPVEDKTDYTFENIPIIPNQTYSFRITAKLLIEEEAPEEPDADNPATEEDEEEEVEVEREVINSATFIWSTAPAVVTTTDGNGDGAAEINEDPDVLDGVYVNLLGDFPSNNGPLALTALGFRCSLSDQIDPESGYLSSAIKENETDEQPIGAVSARGVKAGEEFDFEYLFAPGTTYYYQTYAQNEKVSTRTYGEVLSFTTPIITPQITTGDYDSESVTETSVKVSGTLVSRGGDQSAKFGLLFSIDSDFPENGILRFDYTGTAITDGSAFVVSATGLDKNTKYYYRAFAENAAVNPYSGNVIDASDAYIVTKPEAKTEVLNYTSTTVVLSVPDQGIGNATDVQGFYISETVDPMGNLSGNISTPTYTNENGKCTISSLTPGHNYFVQAYVTNEAGTDPGTVLSFTTKASDDSIPEWDDNDEEPEIIG